MAFCLTKDKANEFLKAIRSRELDINALSEMSSFERRNKFKEVIGITDEVAREVNALFESKLLLKYQKTGIKNWIKKTGGMSTPARRDLLSRVNRMDKAFNPKDVFFDDLVATRLGAGVTREEAKTIYDLSQKAESLRGVEGKELEYGNAVLDFYEYIDTINPKNKDIVANILNIPRTLKSTLDLSAPLRQGLGMISRPIHWSRAFGNMFRYAVSKKAFRNLQADIISRPTYELMQAGNLRVSSLAKKLSQREEQYLSSLVSKIPGVGASERAYVGFLNKLRADIFDDLIGRAQMAGEDISKNSQTVKDIANVVNDFTGSGNIGKGDRLSGTVPWISSAFFSPRKISATLNMINPKRYVAPSVSKTARKAALRQLTGLLGFSVTILGLAEASGAYVEKDPTSADFGTIRIGDTRFDVTGGNKTYATLLARLITGRTKSSTSGKVYELGTGYKPTTRADLILKFTRNKFSPVASSIANALGETFSEEDKTLKGHTKNLFVPMIIDSSIEQMVIDKDLLPYTILAELLGIGVQSY